MKMETSGLVPMGATPGEDIVCHSTLTIIILHVYTPFLNLSNNIIYSWCSNGRVGSTLIACPPKGRECCLLICRGMCACVHVYMCQYDM